MSPPPEAAPGRAQQQRRDRALLFVIVGAGVVVGLISAVALFVPQYPVKVKTQYCERNLERLVTLFGECHMTRRARPRRGQAMLLAWRKDGQRIAPGDEAVLICPGDNAVAPPDTAEARARYDTVDLDAPPDDLVSYCVRDFERFPVDMGIAGDEPVLACLGTGSGPSWVAHHRDRFIFAFADGSVRSLSRGDLGLAAGAPVVIGPDAANPLLRVFVPKRR